MSTEGNPKYSRPAALVLGILQVICGVANIIIQITMFTEDIHTLAPYSIGIWTGIFVSDLKESEELKSDKTMMPCNIRHSHVESWLIFRPKYQHEALTWCQSEQDVKQAVSLPLIGDAMALMTSFKSIQFSSIFILISTMTSLWCIRLLPNHIIPQLLPDAMLFFQFIITGILALISFKANVNCMVSDRLVQYLYVYFDAPIVKSTVALKLRIPTTSPMTITTTTVAKWSPICVNDQYSNG